MAQQPRFLSCLPICCCELSINLSLRRSVNQSLGFLSSLLPPNDWRGSERRRRREHGYITNTHTAYITLWKQCGSSWKSTFFFSFRCYLPFSDSFMTLCPHPSSPEQLRGCIVTRERRVACRLSARVAHPSVYLFPSTRCFGFVCLLCWGFFFSSQGRRNFSTGPPRTYFLTFINAPFCR